MKMGKDLVINGTQWVLEEDFESTLFKMLLKPNFQENKFFIFIACQLRNLNATRYCYNSKVKTKYLTLEGWSSGLRL